MVVHVKISEIFLSIQGESSYAGLPTVFVRCAGCNMSCVYCDTVYAREGGEEIPFEKVVQEVGKYSIPRLTVTGGEPLLQEESLMLARECRERGYDVQVETNGSIDISAVPSGVRTVMDVKTPGSGMSGMNDEANTGRLRPGDEVKYVITSKEDFEWSLEHLTARALHERDGIQMLFSPASGYIDPAELAEWILERRYPFIRFQMQLHRQIWGEGRGK